MGDAGSEPGLTVSACMPIVIRGSYIHLSGFFDLNDSLVYVSMTGVTVCHRRAAKLLLYSNLLDIDGRNAQSMTNEMCIVTLPGGASSDLFRMQQARQPFAYAGSAGIPPSLIGFAVVVVRALQKGCWVPRSCWSSEVSCGRGWETPSCFALKNSPAKGWPIFGLLARLSEVVLYSGQASPTEDSGFRAQWGGAGED